MTLVLSSNAGNIMTTIQLFCLLSTVLFAMLGVMLDGDNAMGMLFKAFAWIMALFGAFVTASVFGFVLQNGIRLI